MLAAACENVPTNTVYLGRYTYGVTLRDVLREPSRGEEMLAAQRDVGIKSRKEHGKADAPWMWELPPKRESWQSS